MREGWKLDGLCAHHASRKTRCIRVERLGIARPVTGLLLRIPASFLIMIWEGVYSTTRVSRVCKTTVNDKAGDIRVSCTHCLPSARRLRSQSCWGMPQYSCRSFLGRLVCRNLCDVQCLSKRTKKNVVQVLTSSRREETKQCCRSMKSPVIYTKDQMDNLSVGEMRS